MKKVSQINPNKESGGKQPYQQNRIYDIDGVAPALCANKSDLIVYVPMVKGISMVGDFGSRKVSKSDKSFCLAANPSSDMKPMVEIGKKVRKLTPIECERLQTVEDNYTTHVSDSQRYKMLGNGWTIDVIAHIFSYLKSDNK